MKCKESKRNVKNESKYWEIKINTINTINTIIIDTIIIDTK